MKFVIFFLVSSFMLACETSVQAPTLSSDASAPAVTVSECKAIGAHKKDDNTCESNCVWCNAQETCIDTTKDSFPDTCVQGSTFVAESATPSILFAHGCSDTVAEVGNWCQYEKYVGTVECIGGNWMCVADAFVWCADQDQDGFAVCDAKCARPAKAQCGDSNDADASVHL